MGAETLSSRAIIGKFYQALEQARGETWIPQLATRFDSDQSIEEYPFLSSAPVMREWVGGRLVKGFDTKKITIPNIHWEATIEFLLREITRDKTGQIQVRILELARRAAAHPQKLISDLIVNGDSSLCYDGQFFFDTDHAEGESGAQSNSITVDITALGVTLAQQGTTTAPSAWTLAAAIAKAINHFFTLKDDRGEPMHSAAKKFTAMLPVSYLTAQQGLGIDEFAFRVPNPLTSLPYEVSVVLNPRLTFTDKFAIFRTDSPVRAFIHQVETEVVLKVKGEGTDFEFDNDAHQYGVDTWFNCAFGYWQNALLVQLI